MSVTWDGLPIAAENPTAVVIVTWRRRGAEYPEFLLLHRLAPGGPDYHGDWAWTPPGWCPAARRAAGSSGCAGAA